jgi:SAM-dependent methyltransferase
LNYKSKWGYFVKKAKSVGPEDYILEDWPFLKERAWNADAVSSAIERWSRPGVWLDLGCGPMLTVWPMFGAGVTAVHGCDRIAEIKNFHMRLRELDLAYWPEGLRQAIEYRNQKYPDREGINRTAINLLKEIDVGNVTDIRQHWIGRFDTIVQVGCFACLESIEELGNALQLVARYLRPHGRFISVTWTPRVGFEESSLWGGYAIAGMAPNAFAAEVAMAGLTVLEVDTVPVDDPFHDQRFIIAAEQRS